MLRLTLILLIANLAACGEKPRPHSPATGAPMSAAPTQAPADTAPPVDAPAADPAATTTYLIVDTGQGKCYDNTAEVTCPQVGEPFLARMPNTLAMRPATRSALTD